VKKETLHQTDVYVSHGWQLGHIRGAPEALSIHHGEAPPEEMFYNALEAAVRKM
jgi:hypothetical protein